MGNLTILIGLGITSFILLYAVFNMNRGDSNRFQGQHVFQVFMFFFAMLCLVLIAKVSLDDKDFCSWNVANSTTSGSTTSYDYEYECSTNPNTTSLTFYKLITWLLSLFFIYILIYYIYIGGRWVSDWLKGGGRMT